MLSNIEGQQIVAQGSTLGFWASREIVRAMTFRKVKFIFRTKMMVSYFPKMKCCNSLPTTGWRPKGNIGFVDRILSDGFSPASQTQGDISFALG